MYDIEKITDPSFIKNLSTKEMQVLYMIRKRTSHIEVVVKEKK